MAKCYKNMLIIIIIIVYIHDNATLQFHGSQCCLGNLPIQKENTNSKKLTIEKLSKSCLNTFVKFAFYMRFPDLIRVTSSAENINLARKRKLGPK